MSFHLSDPTASTERYLGILADLETKHPALRADLASLRDELELEASRIQVERAELHGVRLLVHRQRVEITQLRVTCQRLERELLHRGGVDHLLQSPSPRRLFQRLRQLAAEHSVVVAKNAQLEATNKQLVDENKRLTEEKTKLHREEESVLEAVEWQHL